MSPTKTLNPLSQRRVNQAASIRSMTSDRAGTDRLLSVPREDNAGGDIDWFVNRSDIICKIVPEDCEFLPEAEDRKDTGCPRSAMIKMKPINHAAPDASLAREE